MGPRLLAAFAALAASAGGLGDDHPGTPVEVTALRDTGVIECSVNGPRIEGGKPVVGLATGARLTILLRDPLPDPTRLHSARPADSYFVVAGSGPTRCVVARDWELYPVPASRRFVKVRAVTLDAASRKVGPGAPPNNPVVFRLGDPLDVYHEVRLGLGDLGVVRDGIIAGHVSRHDVDHDPPPSDQYLEAVLDELAKGDAAAAEALLAKARPAGSPRPGTYFEARIRDGPDDDDPCPILEVSRTWQPLPPILACWPCVPRYVGARPSPAPGREPPELLIASSVEAAAFHHDQGGSSYCRTVVLDAATAVAFKRTLGLVDSEATAVPRRPLDLAAGRALIDAGGFRGAAVLLRRADPGGRDGLTLYWRTRATELEFTRLGPELVQPGVLAAIMDGYRRSIALDPGVARRVLQDHPGPGGPLFLRQLRGEVDVRSQAGKARVLAQVLGLGARDASRGDGYPAGFSAGWTSDDTCGGGVLSDEVYFIRDGPVVGGCGCSPAYGAESPQDDCRLAAGWKVRGSQIKLVGPRTPVTRIRLDFDGAEGSLSGVDAAGRVVRRWRELGGYIPEP